MPDMNNPAAAQPVDPDLAKAALAQLHGAFRALATAPCSPLEAQRQRFGRPGPKNSRQRSRGRAGRRAHLPPELHALDVPALLPGDPVPTTDDHPFGSWEFASVWYRRDGTRIPTQPEDAYLAEIKAQADTRTRRVAATSLYHRGAPIWVSTVFTGWDAGDGHQPPLLWQTAVFLAGHPDDDEQFQRRYASEHAARRGHGLIVAAIRAGRRAERPRPV